MSWDMTWTKCFLSQESDVVPGFRAPILPLIHFMSPTEGQLHSQLGQSCSNLPQAWGILHSGEKRAQGIGPKSPQGESAGLHQCRVYARADLPGQHSPCPLTIGRNRLKEPGKARRCEVDLLPRTVEEEVRIEPATAPTRMSPRQCCMQTKTHLRSRP